jgi:hypothetical protein
MNKAWSIAIDIGYRNDHRKNNMEFAPFDQIHQIQATFSCSNNSNPHIDFPFFNFFKIIDRWKNKDNFLSVYTIQKLSGINQKIKAHCNHLCGSI